MLKSLNNKGVALIFVLTMVIIVALLAAIVMGLIQTNSNLNMHQLARTQAYYAGIGALNIAFDRLRKGGAPPNGYTVGTHCTLAGGGCSVFNDLYAFDDFYPATISAVTIFLLPANTAGNAVIPACPPSYGNNNAACVNVRVDYTKF